MTDLNILQCSPYTRGLKGPVRRFVFARVVFPIHTGIESDEWEKSFFCHSVPHTHGD